MEENIRDNFKRMGFFKDLIKNGSGVSSKSFFLVLITILGCAILAVVAFILVWEVLHNGSIHTDLSGLALVIGSVTTLFGTAGATKYLGERNENKRKNDDNEHTES